MTSTTVSHPLLARCFNRHERDAAPYRGQMLADASGVKIS